MKKYIDKMLITLLAIIAVLLILKLTLFFTYKNLVGKHKPYYITRDSDGTIWIGDKPGQKQSIYGSCEVVE